MDSRFRGNDSLIMTGKSYEEFRKLFNAEQFFEAHEVLEILWRETPTGSERDFYQGLIQLAASFVHVQKKNQAGALELFERASRKLKAPGIPFSGMDVLALLLAAQRAVESGGAFPKILPD